MKSIKVISIAVVALMGIASAPSFAQGSGLDADRQGYQGQRQDNRGGNRGNDRNDKRNDKRYDNRNDYSANSGWDARQARDDARVEYYGARGPEWRRGGHIPNQYRNRTYYVDDWRGHNLNAPPRGYQWVQVGGDYVLIAIATGIIANLILIQ